jgi:predicted peptidase
MRLAATTVVSLLLAFAFQAHAEIIGKAGRFGGITIRYKVILPNNYDAARVYPAVLAFAGGGQTLDGVNAMLDRNWREAETRGYIVVSPAAPSNNLFFERGGDRIFPDFLDQILRDYKVERGKFHVAGPSNGGLSAFHIASMYPQYFLSVTGFPGYLREESEARLKALESLCIYMHVGERDIEWQVPMQRQADLLRENGFHLRFTIEPEQGHGIQSLAGDGAHRLFEQFEEACK